jgi:hypothetical protein
MSAMPLLSARLGDELIEQIVDSHLEGNDNNLDLDNTLAVILSEHLLDLNDRGIIRPHTTLPNRYINEISSWNIMCGAETSPIEPRTVATTFIAHRMLPSLVYIHLMLAASFIKSGTPRAEAIALAKRQIDTGSSKLHMTQLEVHDHVTGEDFGLNFENWMPVIYDRSTPTIEDARAGRFHRGSVALDIEPSALRSVEIPLPTGDFIITDWVRAAGFTDLVDDGNPYRGASERESERESYRYAQTFGFTSVRTARTFIEVVSDGSLLAVVARDEDALRSVAGFETLGTLFYDLRQITIADRGALEAIFATIHDEPVSAAQALEEAMTDETIRLPTMPGIYRVSFSGTGTIDQFLPALHPLRQDGLTVMMMLEHVSGLPEAAAV